MTTADDASSDQPAWFDDGSTTTDPSSAGDSSTTDEASTEPDSSPADSSSSTDWSTDETSSDGVGTDDVSVSDASGDESSSSPDDPGTADSGDSTDSTSSTDAGGSTGDPGPPYLFADQYPFDSGAHPPWQTLVDTPNFNGVILKAWEGVRYNDGSWFANNWSAVRDAGGERYGQDWFRGAYLFLRFALPGADQADAYLQAVEQAGGWDSGDIIPIVDVELGNTENPNNLNAKASAQQIIDCTTACADRIREVTGRRVMLYGRGAMRERSITDHMGCDVVWNPSYTAHMVTNGLQSWNLEDIVLWQYCGDNQGFVANLPHSVPGFGKIDISVFIKGANKPSLDDVRSALL